MRDRPTRGRIDITPPRVSPFNRVEEITNAAGFFDPRVHIPQKDWKWILQRNTQLISRFGDRESLYGDNRPLDIQQASFLAHFHGVQTQFTDGMASSIKEKISNDLSSYRLGRRNSLDYIFIFGLSMLKQTMQKQFPSESFTKQTFKKDLEMHLLDVEQSLPFAILYANAFGGPPITELAKWFFPRVKDPIGKFWEAVKETTRTDISTKIFDLLILRLLFPDRWNEEKDTLFTKDDLDNAIALMESKRGVDTVQMGDLIELYYYLTLLTAKDVRLSNEGYIEYSLAPLTPETRPLDQPMPIQRRLR